MGARHILVTRFSALGDVAMTIPVIYGACAANPQCTFTVLTRRPADKLFVGAPPNLRIHAVDTSLYKGPSGMKRLLAEMRRQYGVDTLVDLHDVLRTKLMRMWAHLSGMKVSHVDKGRARRRALTRSRRKHVVPLTPMTERYREAFNDAGLEVAGNFTSIYGGGRGDAVLFAAATPPRQKGETWTGVAPFAAHPGKIYPEERMAEVIAALAGRPGAKVFVFGAGETESAAIDRMAAGHPNVVNMARLRIGIAAELALMSHCDTVLAMDSANMHMASLAGTRAVSIWGATHPYTGFYGYRQDPADAVQLDMTCRPCSIFGNKPCRRGDYHCLAGISPHLVLSAIDQDAHPTPTQTP